jgi:prolyl-tRNA editing enzyme YbaK/EbsC (Cys-tRNA(Pro) deacylase)
MVGGISPFGTRTPLPVYVESTILSLPVIYINGGKRGFLVAVNPLVIQQHLVSTPVDVAIPET